MATTAEINAAYQRAFGRDADAGGAAYWGDKLASGALTAEGLTAELRKNAGAADAEAAKQTAAARDAAVAAGYRTAFGRDAENTGAGYWANKLDSGAVNTSNLNDTLRSNAVGYDITARDDGAQYPTAWSIGTDANKPLVYDAEKDTWSNFVAKLDPNAYGEDDPATRAWLLGNAIRKTDAVGDDFVSVGRGGMDDYEKLFRPAYQKMSDLVDKLGSEDYRAQQRSQAMEGADAQFGMQDQALQRRFQGMGIGSGALADAMAAQASARAMAKVNAATTSDNNLMQAYGSGLNTFANLGLNVNKTAGDNLNSGVKAFGQTVGMANDSAKTEAGVRASDASAAATLANANTADYSARQNAGISWFNADSNRINANNGTISANTGAARQADDSNPMNTILGIATAGLSKKFLGF